MPREPEQVIHSDILATLKGNKKYLLSRDFGDPKKRTKNISNPKISEA